MGIKKRPVSPRQKMINLMYVVLMAMLALNVSTEVLEAFALVENSLFRTMKGTVDENELVYKDLAEKYKDNPVKVKEWFEKAQKVKAMSDSLYNFVEELKVAVAQEADGEDADVHNIKNKDNLEAATQVMLAPGRGRGKELRNAVISYRGRILKMIDDEDQRSLVSSCLSTDVSKKSKALGKNWEEQNFEAMPAVAAITILSKLQYDIRYAENDVLYYLRRNIDVKDIRVNSLQAFVIPNSETFVRGDKFSAHIVMAAVDTTRQPDIFIGNRKVNLKNGVYEMTVNKTGSFSLSGYIQMPNSFGEKITRKFEQKYTVVDPSATVSADLMNVLYAGYSNPISVSVPGVPLNKVTASATGAVLQPVGPGRYIARPTAVGKDVTITVSSTNTGKAQAMGSYTFHVRKLPDPTAYITLRDDKGVPTRFRGGSMFKANLMNIKELNAAIDDGILDINFKVTGFETVFYDNMGNAVPMVSNGASFSDRQCETFRKLARNRRFYITRVNAVGPDGIHRTLNGAMEVIVK